MVPLLPHSQLPNTCICMCTNLFSINKIKDSEPEWSNPQILNLSRSMRIFLQNVFQELLKFCLNFKIWHIGYVFEIITTTTPTIPYYTINPSYCWMPDIDNQEWWVKKLFDGMPTLPTHPAFIPV